MLKLWNKVQTALDIRGGAILGLFSLAMVSLCCFAVVTGKPFPSQIRDIYLGVISAFAATNIAKHYKEAKLNEK